MLITFLKNDNIKAIFWYPKIAILKNTRWITVVKRIEFYIKLKIISLGGPVFIEFQINFSSLNYLTLKLLNFPNFKYLYRALYLDSELQWRLILWQISPKKTEGNFFKFWSHQELKTLELDSLFDHYQNAKMRHLE